MRGGNGICLLDTNEAIETALKVFTLEDIWGIGRQHLRRLNGLGVVSPLGFTKLPEGLVRKTMAVTGLRTYQELKGIPCRGMEHEQLNKKSMGSFKSFGTCQSELSVLREAVSDYTASLAEKLRRYRLCCGHILVYVGTDSFKSAPQYHKSFGIGLPRQTYDTQELVHYAQLGLEKIFREGFTYKRVGVLLSDTVPEGQVQTSLFDTADRGRQQTVNGLLDALNNRFGKGALRLSAQGTVKKWDLRHQYLSRAYTTRWEELAVVRIG